MRRTIGISFALLLGCMTAITPASAQKTLQDILAEREENNPEAAKALDAFEDRVRAALPPGEYSLSLKAQASADGAGEENMESLCLDEVTLDRMLWAWIQPVRVAIIYSEDTCHATLGEKNDMGIAVECDDEERPSLRYQAKGSTGPATLNLQTSHVKYSEGGPQTLDMQLAFMRKSAQCTHPIEE